MLNNLFKSIIDTDTAPIVICDMNNIIVYMNPSAIHRYHKDLTGSYIKNCHPQEANDKIDKVIEIFKANTCANIVFTYHNEKENKDVYMVALRDDAGNLTGYYEKHEYRNKETAGLYTVIEK